MAFVLLWHTSFQRFGKRSVGIPLVVEVGILLHIPPRPLRTTITGFRLVFLDSPTIAEDKHRVVLCGIHHQNHCTTLLRSVTLAETLDGFYAEHAPHLFAPCGYGAGFCLLRTTIKVLAERATIQRFATVGIKLCQQVAHTHLCRRSRRVSGYVGLLRTPCGHLHFQAQRA